MNSHVVLPLDEEKFILIEEKLVVINMTQSEVDHYVEQVAADRNAIAETKEGKVIQFEHLDEITSAQHKKDIDISSVINGGYSIDTISLKSVEDRDKCIEAIYGHIGDKFNKSVKPQKLFDAALLPMMCLIAVAVVGGFISACAYYFQEPTTRTHVVKKSVYIFYQIAKFVGPTIPIVITGVLLLASILFLLRNLMKRPLTIMIEKR